MDPARFQGDDGELVGIVLTTGAVAVLGIAVLFASAEVTVPHTMVADRATMKNVTIEWACEFSDTKFVTTLAAVVSNHVSRANVLVYYYCSMATALNIQRDGGIPVVRFSGSGSNRKSIDDDANEDGDSGPGGIFFSLRGPHALKEGDPELSLLAPDQGREVVMACSIPRWLLRPFEAVQEAGVTPSPTIWLLPGNFIRTISDNQAFNTGFSKNRYLLLPGACIERIFQLTPTEALSAPCLLENTIVPLSAQRSRGRQGSTGRARAGSTGTAARPRAATRADTTTMMSTSTEDQKRPLSLAPRMARALSSAMVMSSSPPPPPPPPLPFQQEPAGGGRQRSGSTGDEASQQSPPFEAVQLLREVTADDYGRVMAGCRAACASRGLAMLYHFTSPEAGPAILAGGLRMSTQGQGDGGVYLSTLGPASYGVGTAAYEEAVIVDCFGKERLEEYRGKHKLDCVVMVGVNPALLLSAPGGRHNAKVVPKAAFHALGSPDADGHYFLPPSAILVAHSMGLVGLWGMSGEGGGGGIFHACSFAQWFPLCHVSPLTVH